MNYTIDYANTLESKSESSGKGIHDWVWYSRSLVSAWQARSLVDVSDCMGSDRKGPTMNEGDIVYRLKKRAEIRRQIPGRKSVVEGAPDRIADLLEEAAREIEALRKNISAPDSDTK